MANIIQTFPTGAGGGGDTSSIELTQAEYDALTPEEQENGTVYYITDALPTNQICYVGSKFNRSDIYKDTETVIGSYLGKPLYQKTLELSVSGGAKDDAVIHTLPFDVGVSWVVSAYSPNYSSPRVNTVASSYAGSVYTRGKNIVISQGANANSGKTTWYVTIQYTKTSDSANSAIYASENDYSTDETIIGKWIDGKPIYQKTVNFTINSSTTAKWQDFVDLSDLNIGDVCYISSDGSFFVLENLAKFPLQYSTSDMFLQFIYDHNRKTLRGYYKTTYNNINAYATIQYTKTTD